MKNKLVILVMLIMLVSPLAASEIQQRFVDVVETNSQSTSIYKTVGRGIMGGDMTGLFEPYKPITREELAVVLTRAFALERNYKQEAMMEDIEKDHWSYLFIITAVENEMMVIKDNKVRPKDYVTRNEIPQVLLNNEVLTSGDTYVTRGEIASMLIRVLDATSAEPLQLPELVQASEVNVTAIATENFVYTLLGEYKDSTKIVTTKVLADILAERLEITYANYPYYRSLMKDTANLNILKCYSEGILTPDTVGNIYPDKKLTRQEVITIIERLKVPLTVARPTYTNRKDVPILMYHEIKTLSKNGPTGLFASKENFATQLDALQREGYNTVTMEELYQHWENKVPLPIKPIILSFDDGYVSHYEYASVELAKRGMTGTFYIITNKLKEGKVSSPKNLKTMYIEGMEIGSHTVTHLDVRYGGNKQVELELRESKRILESILGAKVEHFCYPIGYTTTYALQTLKATGYKTAVETAYGKANKTQGYLELRRIRIDYNDSIEGFLNKIK